MDIEKYAVNLKQESFSMASIMIEADNIDYLLISEGIERSYVMPIQSKGLGGEVVASAALVTLGTATVAAIAKVIVEIIKKEKSFSVKFEGDDLEFSSKNLNQQEISEILKDLISG